MPRSRSPLQLSFSGFSANPDYDRLARDRVLQRVHAIDNRARQEPLSQLTPASDALIPIGTEIDANGKVTKNGYGVLHLPWVAEHDGDWPPRVGKEIDEIRDNIKQQHGAAVKYLIWAGMGGSAEDKVLYQAAKLLDRKVRVYILDSTDPGKLRAILNHIESVEKGSLKQALARTLVVGMAMGMTSYEPVVNLEKLDLLYTKLKIPSSHNFLCMTLPGSILDQFAGERGYRRIALQLDGGNTTAGRHSGPLTRGSLYSLALNNCDLDAWIRATFLDEAQMLKAFELAGFIQGNAAQGRDKLTLFLPDAWSGGAVWTKQDFEESLGKSESIGLKVVIGEKIKLVNYFPRKNERQDRCFLVVNVAGQKNTDAAKVAALRRAGYPLAVLQLSADTPLPRYMQFIHYVVFGLGYLRNMNFVTQPGVELYKKIANEIYQQAKKSGGIERTAAWREQMSSPHRLKWRGGIAVNFAALVDLGLLSEEQLNQENRNAAAVYATALSQLVESGKVSYGELTHFGDMRYQPAGRRLRVTLERAGEGVFRSRLKMPVDIYEGPAMNHSYHEMIIGYGRGFSTILLSEKQDNMRRIQYDADYHRAQWLATQKALAEKGRAVVALTVRDLSDGSRQTIREFFNEVARRLKRRS